MIFFFSPHMFACSSYMFDLMLCCFYLSFSYVFFFGISIFLSAKKSPCRCCSFKRLFPHFPNISVYLSAYFLGHSGALRPLDFSCANRTRHSPNKCILYKKGSHTCFLCLNPRPSPHAAGPATSPRFGSPEPQPPPSWWTAPEGLPSPRNGPPSPRRMHPTPVHGAARDGRRGGWV